MKRYSKLLTMVLVFFMLSLGLLAQAGKIQPRLTLKMPDLTILKITVDRGCNLAVVVKNNGPGALPNAVYTNHHPKSAGVSVYINGNSWGGETIWKFDPAKKLQKPGGQATCILNYKVGPPIDVKAVVDLWNDVKESNERNNTHIRKKLSCKTPGGIKKLPDLIVRDIRLVEGCKIQVTIKNIGTAGVPDSYYDLPNAVGVQMYKGTQAWGGIILKGFDPAGHLKSPGGTATHIWFPGAANLNLPAGTHTLKVIVDHMNVLTELDEGNNSLTRRVTCKKLTVARPIITTTLPQLAGTAPRRFFLDFNEARLVYKPATKTAQIATGDKVLSYCNDWEKCQLQPYLYHFREKFWAGFYWKVNTSRREVYRVTGGTFCKLGGSEQKLDIIVDVIGGSDTSAPETIFLRFKNARLVYVPNTKTLQISEGNTVLSYGSDWDKCNLNFFTYHLKHKFAQTFFWKVDTNKKTAMEVTGGTFCKPGGSETPLPFTVTVVK